MVKKLLHQRRHTGSIAHRHHLAGRKPRIVLGHQRQMRALLRQKPDLTLKELRHALELDCSLQAIHVALGKMRLTYKRRLSVPPNKIGWTSRGRDGASTLFRQELARRPKLLDGKKVIVWEFTERDLRLGTEGWQIIPLRSR